MKINFVQTFKMAISSILSNKMRSFLTMLGVIIGVSTVIILVSIGQGTTKSVTDSIQSMGSNLLTVNITGRGADTSLDLEEVEEFNTFIGVGKIAPSISINGDLKAGTVIMEGVNINGTDENYIGILNYELMEGRFLNDTDIANRQNVAIIGSDVKSELFADVSALGSDIKINGQTFTVVGTLASKGSSMMGSSDEVVVIPVSTAQRLGGDTSIRTIYIQAESAETVDVAKAYLENYLQRKFKGDDTYRVFDQSEVLDTVGSVTGMLTAMLGGIAGISLLVGGIGIMNIMLVSVTERTREIGIRKAIGAKYGDILVQFIIESIVLSGMGGIIGVALGIGGSLAISSLAGIETVVSSGIILLAAFFSLAVGIIFGIYPADKAAKLHPIDALRYE
ncbi:MAG: ABC transporter permease [Peptostreptococcaceae bacterium]|nr:ABC transporter permease [Peptostreptococcaceae bacterium]